MSSLSFYQSYSMLLKWWWHFILLLMTWIQSTVEKVFGAAHPNIERKDTFVAKLCDTFGCPKCPSRQLSLVNHASFWKACMITVISLYALLVMCTRGIKALSWWVVTHVIISHLSTWDGQAARTCNAVIHNKFSVIVFIASWLFLTSVAKTWSPLASWCSMSFSYMWFGCSCWSKLWLHVAVYYLRSCHEGIFKGVISKFRCRKRIATWISSYQLLC